MKSRKKYTPRVEARNNNFQFTASVVEGGGKEDRKKTCVCRTHGLYTGIRADLLVIYVVKQLRSQLGPGVGIPAPRSALPMVERTHQYGWNWKCCM